MLVACRSWFQASLFCAQCLSRCLESGTECGFTGTGDLQNSNPKLGPLASNGGPTQTLALLKGSPAIDVIPLTSGLCPATDQRGHKRPDNP